MAPRHGLGIDYRVALGPGANPCLLLGALARLGPALVSRDGSRAELWLDTHDIAPNVIVESSGTDLIVSDLGGASGVMEAIRRALESRGLTLEPIDPETR
jgi:hypothetical protein